MSSQFLSKDQEEELLAAFKQSDHTDRVIERVQVLSTGWSVSNGSGFNHHELTDLLYDVTQLPDEKRAICEKALLAAGIFANKRALQKRLQSLNPPSASGSTSKPIISADFDGLIDLVLQDGKAAFLVRNEQGEPEVITSIDRGGQRLVPPSLDQIPWLLPRAEKVLENYRQDIDPASRDKQLFEDLMSYHKSISELPTERHYLLLAAFDLHTYLMEKFEYSPMLCFYAVPERGKSRTGKGLVYVAYRGLHVESLREAYIVRIASDCNASLFFDVMNIWKKAEKTGTEDIILSRFERGTRVPRVLDPAAGPFQWGKYFKSFGPTIIATNEEIHHILETRVIPITMPDTAKRFEDNVTPAKALPLKERLVEFRLRHYNDILPEMEKPASGRLGDILRPLAQIIRLVAPDQIFDFMTLVRELEGARKMEKAETLEARLIQAIADLKGKVLHGYLAVKDITEAINFGRPDRLQWSPQRIGRKLKSLGFERGRTIDGASCIAYDNAKI